MAKAAEFLSNRAKIQVQPRSLESVRLTVCTSKQKHAMTAGSCKGSQGCWGIQTGSPLQSLSGRASRGFVKTSFLEKSQHSARGAAWSCMELHGATWSCMELEADLDLDSAVSSSGN